MIISHSILLWMRNISDRFVEKMQTRFIFNNFFFFSKSCRLWDNVEKYCRTEHTTDDNMAHAHCMLDTYDYTFRICNTDCFTRTRPDVKLYVHFLPCLFLCAFGKLRKVTVSFITSVLLSVRMEQLGFHWNYFHKIRYLIIFRKYVNKFMFH